MNVWKWAANRSIFYFILGQMYTILPRRLGERSVCWCIENCFHIFQLDAKVPTYLPTYLPTYTSAWWCSLLIHMNLFRTNKEVVCNWLKVTFPINLIDLFATHETVDRKKCSKRLRIGVELQTSSLSDVTSLLHATTLFIFCQSRSYLTKCYLFNFIKRSYRQLFI